jgi:hypothetical protein
MGGMSTCQGHHAGDGILDSDRRPSWAAAPAANQAA